MQGRPLTGRLRVSTRILLLEDDLLFGETLVDLLEDEGYEVSHVPNGQAALDATFSEKFDLYLLDINVPLIDGVSLLCDLRAAEDETPAVFLTSHTDKEMLKRSFLSGGDDFISKPFDNTELLLRLAALLKRSGRKAAECVGELCHDKQHKSIFYNGTALELSKKEYELLVLLMDHANAPVPKELIHEELWRSADGSGSDGAIRVYINRLKQLLPTMSIENLRGIGYKLVS